jgi:D-lactate dehydrogenase (cytochrome)
MLITEATEALGELLGERLAYDLPTRTQYGSGEGFAAVMPSDLVAFPVSTAEVSRIAAICTAYRVPMIASGACTSLEGHVAAPQGGLAINLAQMNRVLAVNAEDLDCRVEAGVTREQLNSGLRDRGLFFPVDPGANASFGGMAATRASGTNAIHYGTMLQNVLGLTIVQPGGGIIQTGGRSRKSSAGYDLTRLYVGSEGTLGIITEITLRLYGIPESITAATCVFETVRDAVQCVVQLVQLGVPLARVEFLDDAQIRACNAYSHLDLPEKTHLFFEFHGSAAATTEQAAAAQAVSAENGGAAFQWAATTEARNRLWKARHDAFYAARALRPGAEVWTTDICVPVSHLAEAVVSARDDIDANGLIAPIVGHVGDGNFHVLFLLDPAKPDERSKATQVYGRMIDHALACGGTCTGEHGIGIVKRESLLKEHGADGVAVMRAIKHALDPLGLMNPGKIFLD